MTVKTHEGHISLTTFPLITDQLSVPIILGLDVLKNFTINSSTPYVIINNHKIHTTDPQLFRSSALVSAIVEIHNESSRLAEFQKRRNELAISTNFTPTIGSFGDTDKDQQMVLQSLVNRYKLSFSMNDDDLGKLFGFRFSLPFHDETQSTHQPPRPVPIHSRQQVAEEIQNWKTLGLIESKMDSKALNFRYTNDNVH